MLHALEMENYFLSVAIVNCKHEVLRYSKDADYSYGGRPVNVLELVV